MTRRGLPVPAGPSTLVPMRRRPFPSWTFRLPTLALALALLVLDGPARADEPQLTITPRSSLSFGTFAVFGNGSRTVTPQGMVFDSGVFPDPDSATSPAQFDLTYNRGNESKFPIDILIQLVVSDPNIGFQPGLNATVSALTSTLPSAPSIVPGQAFNVAIIRCMQRVCGTSFQVGGRIDVTRSHGSGTLVIPLPIDATVVVVK